MPIDEVMKWWKESMNEAFIKAIPAMSRENERRARFWHRFLHSGTLEHWDKLDTTDASDKPTNKHRKANNKWL